MKITNYATPVVAQAYASTIEPVVVDQGITIAYGLLVPTTALENISVKSRSSPMLDYIQHIDSEDHTIISIKRLEVFYDSDIGIFNGLEAPVNGESILLERIAGELDLRVTPCYIIINTRRDRDDYNTATGSDPADADADQDGTVSGDTPAVEQQAELADEPQRGARRPKSGRNPDVDGESEGS